MRQGGDQRIPDPLADLISGRGIDLTLERLHRRGQ
jgi:hypothetical protein